MYGTSYPRAYMGKESFNKSKLLQNVSERRKNEMCRTKIVCLALFSVLLVTVCCQVGYSDDTVLSLDDLPGLGESLVIESDSILTVNEGETAVIGGVLTLQGTDDKTPELKIINNGLMNEQSSTGGSLDYLLYILVIVAAVIVSLYVISMNRKKSSNASS